MEEGKNVRIMGEKGSGRKKSKRVLNRNWRRASKVESKRQRMWRVVEQGKSVFRKRNISPKLLLSLITYKHCRRTETNVSSCLAALCIFHFIY